MKHAICGLAFLMTLLCLLPTASSKTTDSAEQLLQEARLRPTAHPITLTATIRGGEESLPLIFKIEKNCIEYQLENPAEVLLLKLGEKNSSLTEVTQKSTTLLSETKRYEEIRKTGVTYDDLSLGFLYWPNPRSIGTENLRGTQASLIELQAPAASPYGSARIWIDQNNSAPLRMEGFDPSGNLVKRFEVLSVQKIEGAWMLKEMRIETFNPLTHTVQERRYLTLHKK